MTWVNCKSDGNLGYFTSNRNGYVDRIYEADIKVAEFFLDVTVSLDNCKDTPVKHQSVLIQNKRTGIVDTLETDADGKVSMQLKKNTEYVIETEKENYKLVSDAYANTHGG